MRILDRYLINSFVHSLLYCLSLFLVLFVVIDVFNNLDEFLKSGVHWKIIGAYYLYSLPTIIVQVVPIAVLVSILYVLGSLSRHNEIIAMKASGVSAFHVLAPYLFIGTVISFGSLLISEQVVPRSTIMSASIKEGLIERGKKRLEDRSIKNVALLTKDNRMIFSREFELSSKTLYDVVLLEDDPHRLLQNKVDAKRAVYKNDRWIWYDIIRYKMNNRGELEGEPTFSESMAIDLDARPEDFIKESSQIDLMNTKQLAEYMRRLSGASKTLVKKLSVDFHNKIAFPFASFVVILIGAPLAMKSERGGVAKGIGSGAAAVLLYYGVNSVFLAMGKGDHVPPVMAAWFSNLLFSCIGIYLIKTIQ